MSHQLKVFRKKLSNPIREVFDRVADDTEGWSSIETTKRDGEIVAVRFDAADGLGYITFQLCGDGGVKVGNA